MSGLGRSCASGTRSVRSEAATGQAAGWAVGIGTALRPSPQPETDQIRVVSMQQRVDLTFRSTSTVEVLERLPAYEKTARFFYPGASERGGGDGILVSV